MGFIFEKHVVLFDGKEIFVQSKSVRTNALLPFCVPNSGSHLKTEKLTEMYVLHWNGKPGCPGFSCNVFPNEAVDRSEEEQSSSQSILWDACARTQQCKHIRTEVRIKWLQCQEEYTFSPTSTNLLHFIWYRGRIKQLGRFENYSTRNIVDLCHDTQVAIQTPRLGVQRRLATRMVNLLHLLYMQDEGGPMKQMKCITVYFLYFGKWIWCDEQQSRSDNRRCSVALHALSEMRVDLVSEVLKN